MNAAVTVRELMDREYVGVSESDDLVETVELLLREEAETAVVQRGSEHVGVLTERDVLTTLVDGPDPDEATVGDAMTESVPTVSPDQTLDAAANEMSNQSSGKLVVTDGAEPLGVISERDLLATRTPERDIVESNAAKAGAVVGRTAGTESETTAEQTDSFQDQGICEDCGTLTSDLTSLNGQLLCADCRDM